MEREDLIGKIVSIAGDYRKGEIKEFNAKHVAKWIEQFPVTDAHKLVILKETAHMLGNFYISRETAISELRKMLLSMKQERAGGCSVVDVNFLRTQPEGKSQSDMLLMADEMIKDAKGITTEQCGGSKVYFYIDDCVYSGNKWRYDITGCQHLKEMPKGSTLVSYHFSIYSGGCNYVKPHIEYFLGQKGAEFKPFRCDWLHSERFSDKKLDIMWPTYVAGNKDIDRFVKCSNAMCAKKGWPVRPLFRTNQLISERIFSSLQNQHIVEQAFLAVGAKLFCAAQNPAPSVKPMGFQVIATIGYGTPIVTWRNIANNCPLALWYGDPSYPSSHPFGMWYPLFPRKV